MFKTIGLSVGLALVSQQASADEVLAAWSQIIGETEVKASAPAQVEMRFVTPASVNCADFLVDVPDATSADVLKNGVAPVVRPASFTDITVCRAPLSGLQAQLYDASGAPVRLTSQKNLGNDSVANGWEDGPSNNALVVVAGPDWIGKDAEITLVTLGDTGCRGNPGQDCTTWQQTPGMHLGNGTWPFEQLSTISAGLSPDLVVHVGDFRYFQEGWRKTDSWDLWRKDFFPVAQPLLMAAPWAFARGNHEGCSGSDLPFGVGYFQFFAQDDAISCANLNGTEANAVSSASPAAKPIYRTPWYFDVTPLGGTMDDAHRFVMIDANDYQGSVGVNPQQAEAHFRQAISQTAAGPESSWWVWHSPAVQRIDWRPEAYGDAALRTALLQAAGFDKDNGHRFCFHATPPGCRPSMFLLGHQHLYQDVSFPKQGNEIFPQTTIVGHGGVAIRRSSPAVGHEEYCEDKNFPLGEDGASGVTGVVNTVEEHGLVVWTRKTGGSASKLGWDPQYLWWRNMSVDPVTGKVVGKLSGLPYSQGHLPACKPI